ncbi:MAG: PDZ domain-containing protein [Sedimenticola sp.]|nr:PDZ domain-containing protein [Sedimenticola sp.]
MIDYRIEPLSPEAHLFQVSVTIQKPDPNGQVVSLPAWIPGSYMIRDFARNIIAISAHAGKTALQLNKLDKQRWQLPVVNDAVTIRYQVYAWDLSVRGAHLDTTHGFFNGTSVFLKVEGQDDQACLVEIMPPNGKGYKGWRVATTLPSCGAKPYGFGIYGASNYDELIDHPVEMGLFTDASFEVSGVRHDVVITGKHYADLERICADLQKICAQHIALFGELPEMERYLFLVMAVGDGYGGLEHRHSTALICKRDDLPQVHQTKMSDGYRQFLGLCSHEYFHLWNVKRIKPKAFISPDLSRETYTAQLWAFEGITSYYDDLALLRSGCIDLEGYLTLLAKTISRVLKGPGRLRQSVAESSFDAWTKFYKQDENAPNAIVSYYTKGALIALLLDHIIRDRSDGAQSLDDCMRLLWQQHGAKNIGLEEGAIEQLIATHTGLDLNDFFDSAIRGTEDLDLESALASIGIGFRLRQSRGLTDHGGVADPATANDSTRLVLGVVTRSEGKDLVIANVFDQGAAQLAGLSAGDVLMAIDGLRVTEANVDSLVTSALNGTPVKVHAFRRDELMVFDVTPLPAVNDTCELWVKSDVDQDTLKRRASWSADISKSE